jgi:hypothetical protein
MRSRAAMDIVIASVDLLRLWTDVNMLSSMFRCLNIRHGQMNMKPAHFKKYLIAAAGFSSSWKRFAVRCNSKD